MAPDRIRYRLYPLVFLSGMAALVWEVIWQLKSTLALGVSAWGTALTLALTMGGMSIGALLMGRFVKTGADFSPMRLYAVLEVIIGLAGLCLIPAFGLVERMDAQAHADGAGGPLTHLIGISMILGVPTVAMGATLPVLGLIARRAGCPLAALYGLNTLGAATGTMIAAFILIPALGVQNAAWAIAGVNLLVGLIAFVFPLPAAQEGAADARAAAAPAAFPVDFKPACLIVFATGFATFALEVAWFRSLTGAFMSTTDAFAIMLGSVLLALGAGPFLVPALKRSRPLPPLLAAAGIAILLATPVIERFDFFVQLESAHPVLLYGQWFLGTLWVVGIPVLLLGIALPWLLDEQDTPRRWGILYGLNTGAAIAGSLIAGWALLPAVGFAKTAWVIGTLVALLGIVLSPSRSKAMVAAACAALAVAVAFNSGTGRQRVIGSDRFQFGENPVVLKSYEGPDATISAVEYEDGGRLLFIDGFVATQQAKTGIMGDHVHYMKWMGHLPMLSHPGPKNALVICFGTGQTANAVRNENPDRLTIVDLNQHVYDLAGFFTANDGVLDDPRVEAVVMDGRAFLRRFPETYDVITLEPMPPTFAGVNSLYSKGFYELAKTRLSGNGTIAQWLPFHLMAEGEAKSITKTFQSVFPNAIMWIDPPSGTGILLGSADEAADLAARWPGYEREGNDRDMTIAQVRDAVHLDLAALASYAAEGRIITDDNQALAYGRASRLMRDKDIRGRHEILKGLASYPYNE